MVGGNSLRRELHDFAFSQGPEVIAAAPTPMRTRPVEVAPAHMVEKNPDVSRFGEERLWRKNGGNQLNDHQNKSDGRKMK